MQDGICETEDFLYPDEYLNALENKMDEKKICQLECECMKNHMAKKDAPFWRGLLGRGCVIEKFKKEQDMIQRVQQDLQIDEIKDVFGPVRDDDVDTEETNRIAYQNWKQEVYLDPALPGVIREEGTCEFWLYHPPETAQKVYAQLDKTLRDALFH